MVLNGVTVGYKNKPVLSALNYAFTKNALTVIIGKNGCGKSTLLKSMALQIPLLGGEILLGGKNICDYKRKEYATRLAYLPQIRDTPNITVKSLVEHGRFPYLGFPRVLSALDHAFVGAAMQSMGVAEFSDTPVGSLSGGERQRVYLALSLAQETDVILLDEPTTFIDICDTYKILENLKREAKNKTIIMVLHDLGAAMRYADVVMLLDNGKIEIAAPPCEVYNSNKIPQTFGVAVKKLGETNYYFYKD